MPLAQFREAEPLSPVYRTLATLPRGAVAEFPYWYQRIGFPAPRLLHAELDGALEAARQRLQRSHPGGFREQSCMPLSSFPSRESFAILGKAEARYVVFHLDMYNARSRARLLRAAAAPTRRTCGRSSQEGDVWLLRNRRLAQLSGLFAGLFAALATLHTWPLASDSGASVAARQRRHRVQHLGRRVGRAPAAARSAAPVRRADLLSRAATRSPSRST